MGMGACQLPGPPRVSAIMGTLMKMGASLGMAISGWTSAMLNPEVTDTAGEVVPVGRLSAA